MTWSDVKKTLTTPPPPKPPPPKYPLFTTDPFSTKSFSPGHLVGIGILAASVVAFARFVSRTRREQAEESRRHLAQPSQPPGPPSERPKLATTQDERGQYGQIRKQQ